MTARKVLCLEVLLAGHGAERAVYSDKPNALTFDPREA
jgi:hypothetical protein